VLTFGTDGIRGRYGSELTNDNATTLGACAAEFLGSRRVIIGVDTRESGAVLAAALAHGMRRSGCSVEYVGVAPTPSIAVLARLHDTAAAVVTASHNPWFDNGIKLFSRGGRKLGDEQQLGIEKALVAATPSGVTEFASLVSSADVSLDAYERHVASAVAADALAGMKIVVDCANGAMSDVAPRVLRVLGAECTVIHAAPDGRNINDRCGATHPGDLAGRVVATGAEIGIAFDGDGDRLIAVDHRGSVVDGDRLIALAALDLASRGELRNSGVAVTTMTNLGFHDAMRAAGVDVVVTAVGDRAVAAALEERDLVLGGEQSGHIIHRLHSEAGDGLLSAVMVLELVRRSGRPLAELADAVMSSYPQVLRNVRVATKPHDVEATIAGQLAVERAALGDRGRIVVRASGTEPVVRVMVEAPDESTARTCADRIVDLVERAFSVV
jgi:phosphoglucosamine mutase